MIKKNKNYKSVKFGPKTKRRVYSNKLTKSLEVNDFLEIQRKSFNRFLEKGVLEVFKSIFPITSTNKRIRLEFLFNSIRIVKPKNEYDAVLNAKQKGTTYNFRMYGKVRKIDEETGEVVAPQEILFGEIPLMTFGGSFIVNGSEKIIVSQLLRSPGVYFGVNVRNKSDNDFYNKLEIIPKLGYWFEVFHKVTNNNSTKNSLAYVKVYIDKNRNVSISTFLRSFGLSQKTIIDLFGDLDIIHQSFKKDKVEDPLKKMHEILRKGDRITKDSKNNLYANSFFNSRRYNLSSTGRYMLNRKLSLIDRITNTYLAKDIKDKSGIVHYKKGIFIDINVAKDIQDNFKNEVLPLVNLPEISSKIYGNALEHNPKLKTKVKVVQIFVYKDKNDLDNNIEPIRVIANDPNSSEKHLLIPDIFATISYYFNIVQGIGKDDDPDSLINKRIVMIGELLQNQLQIGLNKMERNAKERLSANDPEKITSKNVMNNKAIFNQFKTFFNSSQLSQFMDQMNPLSEIANKRRITSLGPDGLNRDTAQFEVRDVHSTHYGRICPIETPEGPNIGLILNFANYAKVNEFGFIETPFFPVENGVVQKKVKYLTAFNEMYKTFVQFSTPIDEKGKIIAKEVIARRDGSYISVKPKDIDYIDVSSKQMVSISAATIPFLENDDANRVLMGANMQRQAVPLLQPEAPLVATGIEFDIAKYSAVNLVAKNDGEIIYVDSEIVKVKHANKNKIYYLKNFQRSNQDSVISQKPIVKVGDKVKKGELLVDGPSFDNGELAIGKNVVVGFTTWNGYNYEDAIIMSERIVKDDVFTSLHISEEVIQFRKSKIGDDELTSEIPNVSNFSKRNLDDNGIVIIGSEVVAGDVLVGRVSPKVEENPSSEEKLIAAIFSHRSSNVKDTSLKLKHGQNGTVIDVQILSREFGDKLQDGVEKIIKVFIAQKRKINPGDKMAGRHGNKGVISKILPIEDMPHLADGTPIDVMLNPQGVPSRMNIGQVLELHLGMAAKMLNVKFASPVFDGIKYDDINNILEEANLPKNGKFDLYDPILGKKFDNKVSIGVMYMIKLAHMVDDKMHARSIGPYSLITQQPLGGKSQNGGQRFGEMETWALESYGVSNILQELLTYKSDDIEGRNNLYNALANNKPLPRPGMPESFNVLAYELRGLCLKLGLEVEEAEEELRE